MNDNPTPIPTPRSDAVCGSAARLYDVAMELERELAVARCPHVVSAKEGTAYCDLAESAVARLTKERDELAAWKESALLVESQWDAQKIGKLLGMRLGESIRQNMEPKILELLQDKARLDWIEAGAHALHYGLDCMVVVRGEDGMEFSGETWRGAIDKARAAEVSDSMRQAPVD